ncbi:MAG: hypothetical protein HC796_12130 [Synechococcaceae cyanobacterium RL_1_2]|nr:hypothetical protein [Synechococcaceae cyanobacterium RL_1_2]
MANDCPFFVGGRITNPKFFVGRSQELGLIRDRLIGLKPAGINVIGGYGTGKSSLLYYFAVTY